MIEKIKLNLFDLKPKQDLQSIYSFFKKSTARWFDDNQQPKNDFFHIKNCLLCGNNESKEVFEIDGFSYHECLSCKSIYTKPHLRDGVLDALYSDGTYQIYQDKLVKKSSAIRKGILEERKYSQIKSLLDTPSPSLLDIGCGGGTFLDVCKHNGCYVEGVDPSPVASESILKKYNIHVHQGDFNKITFEKTYDVITLWGVLEHVSDPISTIKKASELLNKDGIIAFEVPSADCFLSEYLKKYNFPPARYIESGRHNIFFSRKGVEQMTRELGLTIELIESNGLDIQTILFDEFNTEVTDKILKMQDTLNDLLLGDHYRVFLKK